MNRTRLITQFALAVSMGILLPACWRGAESPIRINEILASNGTFHADEDGDFSDWIELFNAGDEDCELEGWSLSDDPENPRKWVFPKRSLRAGGYLLVFASDKDRRPADVGELHTNFSLRAGGEFLGLYAPKESEAPASALSPEFPAQERDRSYGYHNSKGDLVYFDMPSPGIPNGLAGSAYLGRSAPVDLHPGRGRYAQPQTITIACEDPAARIRYTLDGSDPVAADAKDYTEAIHLAQSTTIRAVALRDDYLPSPVVSHTFLIDEPEARNTLPVLAVSGDPREALYEPNGIMAIVGGAWTEDAEGQILWGPTGPDDYNNALQRGPAVERSVSLEIFDPALETPLQLDCGLRVHGGFIRNQYGRAEDWTTCPPAIGPFPKFSFRLYFRSRYGSDWLKHAFIPESSVERFDRLVLRGGYQDVCNPFIKDELARRLHKDMGAIAAMGTLANLYINGDYKGYYNVTERLDETFFQARYNSDHNWDITVEGVSDQKNTTPDLATLVALLEADPVGTPGTMEGVEAWLDVDAFIDYLLLQIYCANQDWPDRNWVAAREVSDAGRYRFYVWDSEVAMLPRALQLTPLDTFTFLETNLSRGGTEISRIYRRLAMEPKFRARFQDRIQRHFFGTGALTPANVAKRFAELEADMRGVLDDFDTWIGDVFSAQRTRIVLRALREAGLFDIAPPTMIPAGNEIEYINPNGAGKIWLTTDGSDPRRSGKALIATNAPKRYLVPQSPHQVFSENDAGFDLLYLQQTPPATLPILEQDMPDTLGRSLKFAGRWQTVHVADGGPGVPTRKAGLWDTTFLGTVYVPKAGAWSFAVESPGSFALQAHDLHLRNAGLGTSGRSYDDTVFSQAGLYPIRLDHYGRQSLDPIALLSAPGTAEEYADMPFTPISTAARDRPYPVTPWHHPQFDDAGWEIAQGAIGFGSSLPFDTDIRRSMYSQGTSCLLRIPFEITTEDIETFSQLLLNLRCSHDFAVFLNGWRVAPRDLPFAPQWNSVGRFTRATEELRLPTEYDLSRYRGLLRPGTNLLGLQVMTTAPDVDSFMADVALIAYTADQRAPGATLYTGPISPENATKLRARIALDDGAMWSPLASKRSAPEPPTTGKEE